MDDYLNRDGLDYFWNSVKTTIPNGARVQDGRLYLTHGNTDVSAGVELPTGGGGGDYGSTMRLINEMASRELTVIEGDSAVDIAYTVTSFDSDTNESTGDITASWYVGNKRISLSTVKQGYNSFNVRPYLTGITNTVKLLCEDAYGNSRSITWVVTVTSIRLEWNLSESIVNHGTSALALNLRPYGTGAKTIKVSVDGEVVFTSSPITASGTQVTTVIPAQSHGTHIILGWIEAEVSGESVSTTPMRHVGVWVESGNDTPIISVYDESPVVRQYGTANLLWMAYDPLNDPASVVLTAGDVSTPVSADRTVQTWAYRADNVGEIPMQIQCGDVAKAFTLTVSPLDYDIRPVITGLVLDVNPSGHSNTEDGYNQFGYTEYDFATGEVAANHPFTYSEGFDWVNGGFQRDSAGITAFVVKRGDYIEFDRSFFDDNAKINGKNIELIFKATNCRNYDTEVLSCYANNIGIKLQANQAVISSDLQSRTIPYCEDVKIEMDINIESTAENQIAAVWLRGVPARWFAYSTDGWTQTNPQNVRIGSADADVWIYRIKMYGTSLSQHDMLSNFIADASEPAEMVARYERNDIYTDGKIDIEKLAIASPELRIISISAERMPTNKEDEVLCSVELTYGNGNASRRFTATNVTMKAQGTSSLEYGEAALNLDLDFSEAIWLDGNGDVITSYAMRETSIPVSYFNVKLNVASSENANNVILADDYNAYQPFTSAMKAADSRVRDTVEGVPCAVFFTNTSTDTISVGSRVVSSGETILYGNGDFNNSKKNFAVFGQTSAYPDVCCVEILNNNNAQCLFKSDDLSGELWDGDGNFEFRYPKNPTDEMKNRWAQVLSWVVSTNREAATNQPLAAAVEYDGVTYDADTAAYRLAKFRAEVEEYFNFDSLLYHYLFTERHCMTDNRAKNTFCSYEPDVNGVYRWNFCKDYDNDTAEGNDNSGGLTFTYGLEDTDTVGTQWVFNAHDSVLWCNLRDAFPDELSAMFVDRESAGAWDAYRILDKFSAYQGARPEASVVEDMRGKYLMPYVNNGQARYLGIMLGDKSDQRRQFEIYQERYMAAKYRGSVATSDRITLRANTPEGMIVPSDGDINDVVPYADTYLRIRYGNAGEVVIRAKKGQPYDIDCPADTLSDLETYLYGGSMISSIGSLATLYTKLFQTSYDVAGRTTPIFKLQQIILGSPVDGYQNTNFGLGEGIALDISKATFTEILDLRGLVSYSNSLELDALTSLRELYTTNSGITGAIIARGAPLETAILNPMRLLFARDLTRLRTFSMSGENLQRLWVENSPAIDTLALVRSADNLAYVRLTDVDWRLDEASTLMRLSSLRGLDENGAESDAPVIRGRAHISTISGADLEYLRDAFPQLDITYDNLSYTITFITGSGTYTKICNAGEIPDTSDINTSKAADAQYTYTFIGWDRAIVAADSDTTYTAQYSTTVNKYTITFITAKGNVVKTVAYGDMPDTTGIDTSKNATAQYIYTFTGWAPQISAVTGDATYTAQYSQTVKQYLIMFVVGDEEYSKMYDYGATPSLADFEGATTDRESTAQYTYTFIGWDIPIVSVTGEAVYTAQYEKTLRSYDITFITGSGTYKKTYEYGATPSFSDIVGASTDKPDAYGDGTYKEHTFSSWAPAITTVTGERTYTAQYQIRYVIFRSDLVAAEEYTGIVMDAKKTSIQGDWLRQSYNSRAAVTGSSVNASGTAIATTSSGASIVKEYDADDNGVMESMLVLARSGSGLGNTQTYAYASNAIDLSKYSKLVVRVDNAQANNVSGNTTNRHIVIGLQNFADVPPKIAQGVGLDIQNSFVQSQILSNSSSTAGTTGDIEFDLTNVSGTLHISLFTQMYGVTDTTYRSMIVISKIWLE